MSDDRSVRAPRDYEPVDRRTTMLAALAVALAVAAALAAQLLTRLIGLVTNLAYHGRFVAEPYRAITPTISAPAMGMSTSTAAGRCVPAGDVSSATNRPW